MSLQLRPHPFISTLCGKVMEHVATGNISESQSKLKWINYILHKTRTKLDVFCSMFCLKKLSQEDRQTDNTNKLLAFVHSRIKSIISSCFHRKLS